MRGVGAHLHAIARKSMHSGESRVVESGHAVNANIVVILSRFVIVTHRPGVREVIFTPIVDQQMRYYFARNMRAFSNNAYVTHRNTL